jgi:hypothetical protein
VWSSTKNYTLIQDALNDAEDGDEILIIEASFPEKLYFDREDASVVILGGCDDDFEPLSGRYSTVEGLEIRKGTVEVENLILE